ncbi:hypothetical protein EV677_0063 [Herminiimonas fonticola]|uniref:Uncharacterized protein n=1 Tax=Herminiimonas fonticola TaxID=303380 RepID=A0A4R6GH62_9BURK|nr:hypothetical protein Hfont_0050 [Herminiimonas fonticola]TDN93534.1 hypothetical protein EV677_0063 [Herminiimonas fonticola]
MRQAAAWCQSKKWIEMKVMQRITVMDDIHQRTAEVSELTRLLARLGQNVEQGCCQFFRLEFGGIRIGPHTFDMHFICCTG